MIVDAYLTRAGVFEYKEANGKIRREYRPPEEVRRADSLRTAKSRLITLGHPRNEDGSPVKMTPKNARDHFVGSTGDDVAYEDEINHVRGSVKLFTEDAMEAVDNGIRQISGVYDVDYDPTPGTTPDGQDYDGVQRNIRYNSFGLVKRGRAGGTVQLRADEAMQVNPATDDGETDAPPTSPTLDGKTMPQITIDGVTYECDAALATAVNSMTKELKQVEEEKAEAAEKVEAEKARADEASSELEKLKGKHDALVEERDKLKARADEAEQEKQKSELQKLASSQGVERADEMDVGKLRRAIASHRLGRELPEDASEQYIDGIIDLARADAEEQTPLKRDAEKLATRGDAATDDGETDAYDQAQTSYNARFNKKD